MSEEPLVDALRRAAKSKPTMFPQWAHDAMSDEADHIEASEKRWAEFASRPLPKGTSITIRSIAKEADSE